MHDFLYPVSRELEQMFIKQSTLEVYFEWLDSIIERNVKEVNDVKLHLHFLLNNNCKVCETLLVLSTHRIELFSRERERARIGACDFPFSSYCVDC